MALIPKLVILALVALTAGSTAYAAESAARAYRFFKPGGNEVKWGPSGFGQGATITYDIVGPGQRADSIRNCPDMRPVDVLLRRSGLQRSGFETELERAFAIWQSAINVTFTRAAPGATAQILVGAQGRPVGRAFTDVTYIRPVDKNAPSRITAALICLNPLVGWKIGFDDDLSVYDLRYTFLHEIGHAIGLDHPGASGSVMGFRYTEKFRALQPGDIEAARHLYGRPVPPEKPARKLAASRQP